MARRRCSRPVARTISTRQTTAAALDSDSRRLPSLRSQPRARRVPASEGDAAVLRPAARDEGGRGLAGPAGWYTEVIAPLVREKGKYYAAVLAAAPASAEPWQIALPITRRSSRRARTLRQGAGRSRFRRRRRDRAARLGRHGRHLPQHPQLDGARLGAAALRDDVQGAEARRHARRGRASRRSVEAAGPAGEERLRERAVRDRPDRGAGLQAGGEVRDQRQPEGHEGLRAGRVDAAAGLPARRQGPREVSRRSARATASR